MTKDEFVEAYIAERGADAARPETFGDINWGNLGDAERLEAAESAWAHEASRA